MKTAAEKIKATRKAAGLTQQAFAEKYSIPMRTLQGWELGERVPPAYVVAMIEELEKREEE